MARLPVNFFFSYCRT